MSTRSSCFPVRLEKPWRKCRAATCRPGKSPSVASTRRRRAQTCASTRSRKASSSALAENKSLIGRVSVWKAYAAEAHLEPKWLRTRSRLGMAGSKAKRNLAASRRPTGRLKAGRILSQNGYGSWCDSHRRLRRCVHRMARFMSMSRMQRNLSGQIQPCGSDMPVLNMAAVETRILVVDVLPPGCDRNACSGCRPALDVREATCPRASCCRHLPGTCMATETGPKSKLSKQIHRCPRNPMPSGYC